MAVNPWTVTTDDVPRLIEAILSPQRLHSLTLVSPAGDTGKPRVDVVELLDQVAELPTDVVLLESMEASERLSDSISSAFHCYGGSIRVVMPDARVTDHFRRHPLLLIYPNDDPAASLRRVVGAAERTPLVSRTPLSPDTSPRRPPGPSGPVPKPGPPKPGPAPKPGPPAPKPGPVPKPGPYRGDTAVSAEPVPPPAITTAAAPARPAPAQTTPATEPRPAQPGFDLADIEAVVARSLERVLEEQLGGPSSETERERSRADTAEELLSEAGHRIHRLEEELREATRALQTRDDDAALPAVSDDPEVQLRKEIAWYWLAGPDQQLSDLPDFTVGTDLLAGLQHPVVPRRRTLEVMVRLMRKDPSIQRKSHHFLEGKAGKPRLSAEAQPQWRTCVKEGTPRAPRLTWWATGGGGFHFDHVGPHDDLL